MGTCRRIGRTGGALLLAVTVVLSVALGACAPMATAPQDQRPLVWPDPPDQPRIEFVAELARPADFGTTKGLWQRLADLLFGAPDERMVRPMAVLDAGGVIYVADPGVKGVHRFDRRRGRYDLIVGQGDAPLPSPVGLARGSGGEVYVTDSLLAQVFVIGPQASSAVALNLPKMQQPTGVAYDPATARLYVVDTTAHCIKVFDRDRSLHAVIGRRGAADGEFNYPTQIWRDARGRLVVTDSLNFRIQIVGDDGHFVGRFGQAGDSTGDFMRHKGVATDRHGHIYVVDALAGAVQIFDDEGRLLLVFGDLGSGRGEFWLPAGIFVGDDDSIWVADSYNQRVQSFRLIGGQP